MQKKYARGVARHRQKYQYASWHGWRPTINDCRATSGVRRRKCGFYKKLMRLIINDEGHEYVPGASCLGVREMACVAIHAENVGIARNIKRRNGAATPVERKRREGGGQAAG